MNFFSPFVKHLQRGRVFLSFHRMASSSHGKFKNRLAEEKSPYLLQHAYNPVDWYPWGEEAFEKARREDKPIFLSVGYSTCHWCHVMERESFENEDIGKLLNEKFVSIKVDREERPDVDKVYMTFVQATSGGGGWPMSVWLTPDLKPIVGGTYFPPDDRYYGRPGFKSILNIVSEQWKAKRELIDHQGTAILDALSRGTLLTGVADIGMPGQEAVIKCYEMLEKSYDEELGGFGKAPKFPQPVNFNFLLCMYSRDRDSEAGKKALEMCTQTLRFMAKGGINDHISKGFHRYSTDRMWHVPHFEKMLYDQAQLLVAYSLAYQITRDETFSDVVRDIVEYTTRDLCYPEGGFYSAEDADSYPTGTSTEKKEGAFCVWTYTDIQSHLAGPVQDKPDIKMADVFCYHYSIEEEGNVDPLQDPHEELKNQNVLIVKGTVEKTAEQFNLSLENTQRILEECRQILYDIRQDRPKPHRDTKILSAWNGLMISGLSRAAAILSDLNIKSKAEEAASFVQKYLYKPESNTLLRSCYPGSDDSIELGNHRGQFPDIWHRASVWRTVSCNAILNLPNVHFVFDSKRKVRRRHTSSLEDFLLSYTESDDSIELGQTPIEGFVDDYTFMVRGLLDLYETTFDDKWITWAEQLQTKQDELFWDGDSGGYYNSHQADSFIVLRLKEDQDGAEPCANSVAVTNLLRLNNFLNKAEYVEKANKILHVFNERLTKIPLAVPEMVCGLMFSLATTEQVILVGDKDSEDLNSLIKCVTECYIPNKVLIVSNRQTDTFLRSRLDILQSLSMIDGRATAYVCENYACSLPVTSPEELSKLLR